MSEDRRPGPDDDPVLQARKLADEETDPLLRQAREALLADDLGAHDPRAILDGMLARVLELQKLAGVRASLRLNAEVERLRSGIRSHRDARGDDRCWRDDEDLYRLLPEGYTPPERDSSVELERCRQYIASRQNPATVYLSPELELNRLRDLLAEMRAERDAAIIKHGADSGFWGRMAARLVSERQTVRLKAEKLREEVKRLQIGRIGDAENTGREMSKVDKLRLLLLGMKHGSCWCEAGIGNPMFSGHTQTCRDIQSLRLDE